ncbi:Nucleolar protein 9 [Chytriomyces hyalinus]|nr:Nucleolar protein 9 [Chytriomyces hyalinus]
MADQVDAQDPEKLQTKKKPRRGKRGGAAVKANAATTEASDAVAVKVEAALPVTVKAEVKTETAVETNDQPIGHAQAEETTDHADHDTSAAGASNSNANAKKPRRGKRGGNAKKEKEVAALSAQAEEEYPAFDVIEDSTAAVEGEAEEGNEDAAAKLARKLEQKSRYTHAQDENGNDEQFSRRAPGSTYKDSDKPLPHRDPSLPDQPELGRVDPDVQEYFISIEKMLDENDFEADEDRVLFIQNVYREVGANDVKLAADSDCSRVLEKLIRLSTDVQVRRLMRSFNGMFSELFRHRFASHVTQTLLSLVADIVEREQIHGLAPETDEDASDETVVEAQGPLPSMEELFTSMCEELSNQWIQLMTDPWGSHLVRAVLNVASGDALVSASSTSMRSKKSQKYNAKNNMTGPAGPSQKTQDRKGGAGNKKRKVPQSFGGVLEGITQNVLQNMKEYEIRTFCAHAVANPVLQILVAIKPSGQELINSIIEVDADNNYAFMDSLIMDTVGSHLCEKILANATPVAFHSLYTRHFKGKLASLCSHHVANFVVQHLIANTRNGTQLRVLLEEILGEEGTGVEKLFFRNRAGVVTKILEACVKHNACQKPVLESFISAFHANTPEQLKSMTQLVMHQQTYEDFETAPRKDFDYHGAIMVEHLLQFSEEHAKIFVDSFMNIPSNVTYSWLTTPLGSRIYEKVLRCPATPLKAKKKLLHILDSNYAVMAADKYGRYVVDEYWTVADIEAKERIAEELSRSKAMLEASFTGKFILKNCRIEAFRREGREAWAEKVTGVDRKREMFKEFEDVVVPAEDAAAAEDGEGAGGDHSAADRIAAQENSLWTSTNYNDTMAALGFRQSANAPKSKTEKKIKAKATGDDAELEDAEKLLMNDDAVKGKKKKRGGDDIDELFKQGAKKARGQLDEAEEPTASLSAAAMEIDLAPIDSHSKSTKKKSQTDDGIDSVLQALAATGKGSKGGSSGDKKPKEKKRKKFES